MTAVPATFAAGCFWGTEKFFSKRFKGALMSHQVGYMGGVGSANPGYELVCTGTTGHAEVLHVTFDSSQVSYSDLLLFFFKMHNPTTMNRQGNDKGSQYRSAVFYHSAEQKAEAEAMIRTLSDATSENGRKVHSAFHGAPIVTTVEPAGPFFPAEEYHQKYLDANPTGYCNHRMYWD
jgi:peptide-methionine (S)-S-oxide reductase